MLLEFKFKNFKTFQKETLFSMTPANKIKDIEYSVLKTKIGKKEYKVLSSAVIYGPNASGKTEDKVLVGVKEAEWEKIVNK